MVDLILVHSLCYNFYDFFKETEDFGVIVKNNFSKNFIFTGDGRTALGIALKNLKLEKKDEIIVPSYMCKIVLSTIEKFCTPVLADINRETYLIDVNDIERRISSRTKAILAVHLYGNPCDMNKILELANEHSLYVIEDVAQAIGGRFNGEYLGKFGDYSFFSFRFSKDITSFKGGLLISKSNPISREEELQTQNDILSAIKLLLLLFGSYGMKYMPKSAIHRLYRILDVQRPENFKFSDLTLSSLQKKILSIQFKKLSDIINTRRKNAEFYNKKLKNIVKIPKETSNGMHTYMRYTIQVEDREELSEFLLMKGIQTEKMYNYSLGDEDEYPYAFEASRKNLNIPVHHELKKEELERVVRAIYEFYGLE